MRFTDMADELFGPEAAARLIPLFAAAYPGRNPADLVFADTVCRLPTLDYLRRRAAAGGRALGDDAADCAAAALSEALNALGKVTGEYATDAVIDRIFARFCVGK